jgi:hypothetical protein
MPTPSYLEFLRQQNIYDPASLNMTGAYGGGPMEPPSFGSTSFGNTDLSPYTPSATPESPPLEEDISSIMQRMYKPQSAASNKYSALVSQYPQREKPSWLRAIGSMIVDYTKGREAGQAMFNQPYNDKLTDWKNKIGPVQQEANLERYENTNDRTMAYQNASNILKERAQAAKEKNDEGRMKIAQDRAEVYRLKALNVKFNFQGPKVIVTHPDGKIDVTDIDTGNLTATDKINANQENALERIGATGAQARQTEQVRQTGRAIHNIPDPTNPSQMKAVKINQITGEVQDIKQSEKSVGPVARPLSGSQTNKVKKPFEIAQELKNTRPDLAPFINFPTGTQVQIEPVSTKGPSYFTGKTSGPTPAQFKEINDRIYGGSPVASHGPSTSTPTSIRVRKGKQTGIFKGTEAEAIAAGYEVVK